MVSATAVNASQVKNTLLKLMMLMVFGLIQAIALASPMTGEANAFLQVIALAGFLVLLKKETGSPKYLIKSWLFATSWLIGTVWWLYISIHQFGGLPMVLTLVTILLLCGGLGLYYAVTVTVYFKWKKNIGLIFSACMFASCWTLAELARAELFTGFPWGAIGYAHIDSVLVNLAPWVGVYGVGWLAAFVSALIADNIVGFSERKQVFWKNGLPLAMVLVLLIPWKFPTNSQSQSFSVSLMQANVPQDLKFTKLKEQSVEWFVNNAIEAKTDLVVMPETAIPYLRHEMPQKYWAQLENHFSNSPKALIVGIPTYEEGKGFGNSAIGIQGQQAEYIYHKHHLVPFGEFIPQYFRWFNEGVNFGMTDFIRGPVQPEPFSWMGQQLAIQICYEDLFGEELARRFTVSKDKLPTVLVNMSNIAWFGNTVVIPQHLNIARMRSIELNRPTIRATNSGGTAIIDAQGNLKAVAKPYTQTVLVGDVPTSDGRVTWFATWAGHWGLWPMWLLCFLNVMVVAIAGGRVTKMNTY